MPNAKLTRRGTAHNDELAASGRVEMTGYTQWNLLSMKTKGYGWYLTRTGFQYFAPDGLKHVTNT